jgi:hypothetical protein
MNQKTTILIASLFALIVAGMFIFAQLKKNELEQSVVTPADELQPAVIPYADVTRIDAKHYFIDGKHTLVGEVLMPTPCDLLEASPIVAESMPEQVSIDFSVINTTDTCARVVTAQRFKVDFDASEQASIKARFMGRDIEFNLIPAAPGELPEDFEVFIKG